MLSYAGRLQLVKAVLASLHVYCLATFLLPMRTVYEINRACRVLLWCGVDAMASHALISWEDVAYPYEEGGIRLRDALTVNRAMKLRHVWNIVSNRDILWIKWIKENRIKNRDFWSMKILALYSWSWRSILKGRKEAVTMVRHIIGDGKDTRLWKDPWSQGVSLNQYFPCSCFTILNVI